jgi:hypothetical protein
MIRKQYTPAFKTQVVKEVLAGERTLAQIAVQHGVHPNLITKWKRAALQAMPSATTREWSLGGPDGCPEPLSMNGKGYWSIARRCSGKCARWASRALGPGPGGTTRQPGQQIYPYLLRDLVITRPNQVWGIEIVCTQMTKTDVFAGRGGRNHVANFHVVVRHHDPINH